jgi:hypothetical protein
MRKIQMLPPIEFFMGMLAGGLLGYLVAIMVSWRQPKRREFVVPPNVARDTANV